MIVGKDVAKVSSELIHCTQSMWYEAIIGSAHFRIYDTANSNEGSRRPIPHWIAIRELYTLIRELDGVSLLIHCMRGTIKDDQRAMWTLWNDVICSRQVPVISVVTGLEQEENLKEQARTIQTSLMAYNMKPRDIATVVSIRGRGGEYSDLYENSQERLRVLIMKHHRAWSTDWPGWFRSIYEAAYKTRLGLKYFGATTKVEYRDAVRKAFQEFIAESNMEEPESKKLRQTLLEAERETVKKWWWWLR